MAEPLPKTRTTQADDAAYGVMRLSVDQQETSEAGPSDEVLLAGLRSGDRLAGEMLVQKYHAPLMRYLTRHLSSPQRAEEALQQTWLSVLEHANQFRPDATRGAGRTGESPDLVAVVPGSGFKAWLFRIATNKAHDLWRHRDREKRAFDGLRLVRDESSPEASQRMESDDESARVRDAIDQLPESQREIVMLRYYAGLKFTEIAELLGCPLNTALGRMHKAMQKLKVSLNGEAS